ncbi:hypothetical protein AcV5_006928 [Taiwanofungus camphoratus]|nr:hypothetical protein AcV5_006928 [Antrodia cinnamomea]
MEASNVTQSASVDHPTVPSNDNGPVPMSFPAILRNPGISNRFAHLRASVDRGAAAVPVALKKNKRDAKEGKRWVRRKENARFVGNVHIVTPSKSDFSVSPPDKQSTFPQPLPHYLARNNTVPATVLAIHDPNSANAGRFSLSLRGMRRELRKHGPGTQVLVRDVENEIVSWLADGGIIPLPDAATEMSFPGISVGNTESIREVSRTPLQLVWSIEDNSFTRYVVHCCARYHDVVSFSKETSGQRLTYLLRPNVTRPSCYAPADLDTPPVTDLESSTHEFDSESDFVSDRDCRSDAGVDSEPEAVAPPGAGTLSTTAEGTDVSASSSPVAIAMPVSAQGSDDGWLLADVEDDSEAEQSLATGIRSLTLEPDSTPRAHPRMRQASFRSHLWERQRRSASSPSRSPARRLPQRAHLCVNPPRVEQHASNSRRSFYDYLYA